MLPITDQYTPSIVYCVCLKVHTFIYLRHYLDLACDRQFYKNRILWFYSRFSLLIDSLSLNWNFDADTTQLKEIYKILLIHKKFESC